MPPRGQPDDEQTGVAARLEHALFARRSQQRLGRDAEDALDGKRAVREQAARVALPLLRHGGRTGEPERRMVGVREPCAELDGRRLLMTHGDGKGAVWDVDAESWAQRACAIANRTLTPEEWEEFLPGRPYEPACRT